MYVCTLTLGSVKYKNEYKFEERQPVVLSKIIANSEQSSRSPCCLAARCQDAVLAGGFVSGTS